MSVEKNKKKILDGLESINNGMLDGRGSFCFSEITQSAVLVWDADPIARTQHKIEVRVVNGMFVAIYFGDDDFPEAAAHKKAFYAGNNDQLYLSNPSWKDTFFEALLLGFCGNINLYNTIAAYEEESR